MRDFIHFDINGKTHEIRGPNIFTTLANWLRYSACATGTKIVCEEGDCGACTVLVRRSADEEFKPVNSCILTLAQMDGAPWVKALEPLTSTLPYDLAVTAGGVPTAELEGITARVLILGGSNSPAWFQRSVAEQAAATPGAQLTMLDGYDHNAPPEVITPILTDFFGDHR